MLQINFIDDEKLLLMLNTVIRSRRDKSYTRTDREAVMGEFQDRMVL